MNCPICKELDDKCIDAIISGDAEAFQQTERERWVHKCKEHLGIDPAPMQESLFEMEAA